MQNASAHRTVSAMGLGWGGLFASPLQTLANACVEQSLSVAVPAEDAAFAARKGRLRLAARTARRALLLCCSGQSGRLTEALDPSWRRLVWIHEGMPQIGDALMDLAPRSLLVEFGIRVDLFAAPHIAELFQHDHWFRRSISFVDSIDEADYDAVIVLSHDRKSLVHKRARLARLPWVSLQGFYGGPDFHRARYSTVRISDLLGIKLSAKSLDRHSRQKLGVDAREAQACLQVHDAGGLREQGRPERAAHDVAGIRQKSPSELIAFALGGVHAARTYHRWFELLDLLRDRGFRRFVLLGGTNGRALADELMARAGPDVEVLDFVGRITLHEARRHFDASAASVCADGGLMHLALTTAVPVVAMFSAVIRPEWRMPLAFAGAALRSATADVDGVAPAAVASAVEAVALRRHNATASSPIFSALQ